MPWLVLLRSPWTWVALAFVALAGYAAVQHIGWKSCQADYAQFRADVESEAAKAKVRNAQEAASQAQHAQESLDDLQARNATLAAAYERLRHAKPGGRPVPSLSSAAPSLGACPGQSGQPDPAIGLLDQIEERVLAVLAKGDAEIAKYVELYRLEETNAAKSAQ
jgi:hypothetical protein